MNYSLNLYTWEGIDENSQTVVGSDYAQSRAILKYKLLKEKVYTRNIKRQYLFFSGLRRWKNSKNTLLFLSQLAAILKTGISFSHAFKIIKTSHTNKQLSVFHADVSRRLIQGKSVSQVLKNYPVLFDQVIVQLFISGELTGKMDMAAQQAVDYFEQKTRYSNDFLTALLYPLILGLISLAVVSIMLLFVIPQFESIYIQSENNLPRLTEIVLSISKLTKSHLLTWIVCFFCVISLFYIINKYTSLDLNRLIPKPKHTLIKLNSLKISTTLHELYQAGLPLTDAILICKNLSSNPRYQMAMDIALDNLSHGHGLAVSLEKADYFEPLFIHLLRTGEESANLNNMLEQCRNYYQKQLTDSLIRLKLILEPVLIVVLGILIGIILIAMYLPVFNLGANF